MLSSHFRLGQRSGTRAPPSRAVLEGKACQMTCPFARKRAQQQIIITLEGYLSPRRVVSHQKMYYTSSYALRCHFTRLPYHSYFLEWKTLLALPPLWVSCFEMGNSFGINSRLPLCFSGTWLCDSILSLRWLCSSIPQFSEDKRKARTDRPGLKSEI